MNVKIYVYHNITSFAQPKVGAYTYVLATEINGKEATLTKTEKLEPMTSHQADLVVLLKALKRLNKTCDLEIIGTSDFIKNGCEKWLPRWEKYNWKTAKGTKVANKEEWQQLNEYMKRFKITINTKWKHEFYDWMKAETKKVMQDG